MKKLTYLELFAFFYPKLRSSDFSRFGQPHHGDDGFFFRQCGEVVRFVVARVRMVVVCERGKLLREVFMMEEKIPKISCPLGKYLANKKRYNKMAGKFRKKLRKQITRILFFKVQYSF